MTSPMNTIRFTTIALILSLSFAACQDGTTSKDAESDGKSVSADLYVRYLADERSSKMTVSFYTTDENRKRTPYEEPVKMWYQGRALSATPAQVRRGSYQIDLTSMDPDTIEFRLEKDNGKEAMLNLDMTTRRLPDLVSFSKSDGLILDFKNAPLAERESLVIVMTDANNKSLSHTVNGPADSQKVVGLSDLETLQTGKVDLYTVHKLRHQKALDHFTFNIEQEFYFKKVEVDLKA